MLILSSLVIPVDFIHVNDIFIVEIGNLIVQKMKENNVKFFLMEIGHNNWKNPTCYLDEKRGYFSFIPYALEVNRTIWFHGWFHEDKMKIFIEILVFFSILELLNYLLTIFAGLETLDDFAALFTWLIIAEYGECERVAIFN